MSIVYIFLHSLGLSPSCDIGISLTHVCNSQHWTHLQNVVHRECLDRAQSSWGMSTVSAGSKPPTVARASASGMDMSFSRGPTVSWDSAGAGQWASPYGWPGAWTSPLGTPRVPASPAGSTGAGASPSGMPGVSGSLADFAGAGASRCGRRGALISPRGPQRTSCRVYRGLSVSKLLTRVVSIYIGSTPPPSLIFSSSPVVGGNVGWCL